MRHTNITIKRLCREVRNYLSDNDNKAVTAKQLSDYTGWTVYEIRKCWYEHSTTSSSNTRNLYSEGVYTASGFNGGFQLVPGTLAKPKTYSAKSNLVKAQHKHAKSNMANLSISALPVLKNKTLKALAQDAMNQGYELTVFQFHKKS